MAWEDDFSHFIGMHENDSLRQLLDAYEEESRIFQDITEYEDYDDKYRQLSTQQNHIEAIKVLIDRKSKT